MPKFRVYIERDYTVTEGFERDIDADNREEAEKIAEELALDANEDCPDDISESGGGGAGDFGVGRIVALEPQPPPLLPIPIHDRIANMDRYSAALDELGIPPNGDDFNALLDMAGGALYRPPHTTGR